MKEEKCNWPGNIIRVILIEKDGVVINKTLEWDMTSDMVDGGVYKLEWEDNLPKQSEEILKLHANG